MNANHRKCKKQKACSIVLSDMKMSETTEEIENELVGKYVKLRKRDAELYQQIDQMLGYGGEIGKALERKWDVVRDNDPDRLFKVQMAVKPDTIIELAEKLRTLQKEYMIAHQNLREFESKNPNIVEKYRTFY